MRKDLRNASRAIPAELLQLAVKADTGATYFGEVLALGAPGIETRFDRENAPALAVGRVVTLAFRSPRFAKPMDLKASVTWREETELARGYGFRLEAGAELELSLQVLYSLVNQRHAHRVRPRMTESIAVVLALPERDAAGETRRKLRSTKSVLRDISVSGLSVTVPPDVEPAFSEVELLQVAVHMPHGAMPLPLMAWVRNRRLEEAGVTYGLEFDAERSEQFDARHKEIVDYVMRRQREQLRVRARDAGRGI